MVTPAPAPSLHRYLLRYLGRCGYQQVLYARPGPTNQAPRAVVVASEARSRSYRPRIGISCGGASQCVRRCYHASTATCPPRQDTARTPPGLRQDSARMLRHGVLLQHRLTCHFLQQSRLSHAQGQLNTILNETLNEIKSAGTWKEERVIVSPQRVAVRVQNKNNPILNFCANNYLGLSNNPEVIEASKAALDKYGAGLSSVRFICGTQDIHKELEGKIAKFHNREDAILYISCFDANAGIFEVLLGPDDAVLSDELNHASLIDGIRLCKAKKNRYKHRDMEDLEKQLKENSSSRIKLIVTDGVFSMDGTVAPLPQIIELAERYNALTLIDECHATGFFGSTGRGTEEYHGVSGKIDIINSTLGKALGGAAGGYTTGKTELIQLLRQRSRPYLFSNSPPPAITATANKVLDMLLKSPEQLISRLKTGTEKFRTMMKAAGFTVSGDNHPICPVMIGDAALAAVFAEKMLGRGVYVVGFSYPVVPKGKARIRVQISAAHTAEDIDYCVDAFVAIGRELKIIP